MIENTNSESVRALFEQSRKGNVFEFEQAGVLIFTAEEILPPSAPDSGSALP